MARAGSKRERRHDSASAAPDAAAAERAILEFVHGDEYHPMSIRELLRRLHAPAQARPLLRRLIKTMVREGKLSRISGNRLAAATGAGTIRGRLERHRFGYGFVVPEDGSRDVFVPPRGVGDAMHGDIVSVRVTGRGRDGRLEGAIVGIIDRRSRRVLGLYQQAERGGFVQAFDPTFSGTIHVPGAYRLDAADGDAVEIELLHGPRPESPPEGRVVEVLGSPDRPGVDTLVVARRHGLSLEFPDDALAEADVLPEAIPRSEAQPRERFDDPPPVTIDGETARDFDDAIAVSELPAGGFRLQVHIADVSHFVSPGGALDREARARGTSVYFPDRVLPMFPERLSNDLCSLRPGEDRLVQSVILDVDATGRVHGVRFADGVIRSAARLTYTQVAAVLDGGHKVGGVPARVVPMLRAADRLRAVLESRRRARGSVDFDLPEPKILLDVEGAMTGITIEPRNRAHTLIEECMLSANEAVAARLQRRGAPCMYRVHEKPDPLKIESLAEFVKTFGLTLDVDPGEIRPRDLRRLMDAAEGRPEYPLIAQVALRSMKQARYSAENTGHFGLAARVYCHFTSPIRRYPDLMVHRLLRGHRAGDTRRLAALADGLESLSEICSRLERVAEAAERELLEWKKIRFLKGKEGDSYAGIVTGIAPFGVFVQLTESLVEGLLRVERLGDERFEHLEHRQELLGRSTGRSFRLGDRLRVVLTRVDPVLRRVDLALEGEAGAVAPRGEAAGPGSRSRRQRAAAAAAGTASSPRPASHRREGGSQAPGSKPGGSRGRTGRGRAARSRKETSALGGTPGDRSARPGRRRSAGRKRGGRGR